MQLRLIVQIVVTKSIFTTFYSSEILERNKQQKYDEYE